MPARGPELGAVCDLERKPRRRVPRASCQLPHTCSASLPAATRNPHPSHPQEPVEHGRKPHAHQVRRVHRCGRRRPAPARPGPGRRGPCLHAVGASGRTGHVTPNSQLCRVPEAGGGPLASLGFPEGFFEEVSFEVSTSRMRGTSQGAGKSIQSRWKRVGPWGCAPEDLREMSQALVCHLQLWQPPGGSRMFWAGSAAMALAERTGVMVRVSALSLALPANGPLSSPCSYEAGILENPKVMRLLLL